MNSYIQCNTMQCNACVYYFCCICNVAFRTHTPMRTSCWRQLSSWHRLESVTQRRSTRQLDTWKSGSRTLSVESNTGSCCWISPSPSTHTPKRWETQEATHSKAPCCFLRVREIQSVDLLSHFLILLPRIFSYNGVEM